MDDLFPETAPPTPAEPRILSVTELTRAVRALVEENLGRVWVQGEVCGHRRQSSGHQYFSLKDERCQVSCVLFHRPYQRLRQAEVCDGMAVQVRGDLTVYEARGQYQIVVDLVQPAGVGLLQARFEALKRRLEAEGLFEAARKRPLPKFPRRIGIVTSPTGAAIRDLLNILERRASWVEVIVNPVRVQGEGAGAEIAAAVREFNGKALRDLAPVDLIVVARGGGSAEDLWAFNDEGLARAIFESDIPVVSAVGHEIDFTIADFVADLRAPTPSAAAELIVPDATELKCHFSQIAGRLSRCLGGAFESARSRLAFLSRGTILREPRQRLMECLQRVDSLEDSLQQSCGTRLRAARQRLESLGAIVRQHRPDQVVRLRRQEVSECARRIGERLGATLIERRQRLTRIAALLRILSPQATLERGYSITLTEEGTIIRTAASANSGEKIVTRLRDGSLRSVVQ
jgi:exodeoxyribonuclease VII large subunit